MLQENSEQGRLHAHYTENPVVAAGVNGVYLAVSGSAVSAGTPAPPGALLIENLMLDDMYDIWSRTGFFFIVFN